MTDGIIQQVFKKLIDNADSSYCHLVDVSHIRALQQELIEKIDGVLATATYFNDFEMIKGRLIGDNKE